VAAMAQRGYMCLLLWRAFFDMALSRGRAPAAPSPDFVRRWFAPARRKREVELRHAVLQAAEGLPLPEGGQDPAPGRPRLDCLVEMSRRLRSSCYGVRNGGCESGRGSGRGQADRSRIAFANPGPTTTRILRGWFRSL